MRIAQSDKYQGNDWWEWSIWIDGTPQELNTIESVTYTLHPSFHPPVRRVTDRSTDFRLEASGWGVFPVFARVNFKDGSSQDLKHDLLLHYPDTEKKAPALIRFANLTSGAADHASSLKGAILDMAPNADITLVKTPPAKGSHGPIPSGEALSVDLTGPAVAALARGIQSWLGRNTGVKLELVTEDGKNVTNITPENVLTTLHSAMTTLRK